MATKAEEKKPEAPQTLTTDQMVQLIKQMSEANKEFAATLAHELAHPKPTEEELERRRANLEAGILQAKEEEASKENRRKHCCFPAQPSRPHRRTGTEWGVFNGTSAIAWQYSRITLRDKETGRVYESPEMPQGVCQWCHSEFKPGDVDYEEAISWGLTATAGVLPMNVRTGIWQ